MSKDVVQDQLVAMGKTGLKIARARERVFEILQAENSCSVWYREKDPDPLTIFRSLNFTVDQTGPEYVVESRDAETLYHFHDPYVAKIGQATGANATITLNAKGAFFRFEAKVLMVRKEGGPMNIHGNRYINVGSYAGDTLQAQVLVLLHELGHAIDLLPVDSHDVDGKSVQNTDEVLRYCRGEIESKHSRTLSALRR
jgi:hypothetical protein